MVFTRIISLVKEHKQGESLNSVTKERDSASESEAAVNLVNNGTGTVIYDQLEAQEQTTNEAEVEVTAEVATADKAVADQEKATAEATAALATTEVVNMAVADPEKATAETATANMAVAD
mmetsp:Transcript_46215/g.52211  ORF Transcript_46215/g.52211 Transcript_46215/m.52211 type:complete len:120 (+) Transcript_46215:3-362(+)